MFLNVIKKVPTQRNREDSAFARKLMLKRVEQRRELDMDAERHEHTLELERKAHELKLEKERFKKRRRLLCVQNATLSCQLARSSARIAGRRLGKGSELYV